MFAIINWEIYLVRKNQKHVSCQWYENGEKSTKFFLTLEKARPTKNAKQMVENNGEAMIDKNWSVLYRSVASCNISKLLISHILLLFHSPKGS